MPIYGVSIEKTVSFRGVQQPFANVYFYEGATLTVGAAGTLAGVVKANEVSLHSLDVSFVGYRVWSAGGGPTDNQMIDQGTLTGTGDQVTNASMDRERAVLVQWPAGFNIRGQPVYLRKWYHSSGHCAGVSFGTTVLQNTAQISTSNRTAIATDANENRAVTANANVYNLVSQSGRQTTGTAVCHPWLEHHQLGDQWR